MDMVKKEWYTLCWGAKWLHEKKVLSSALIDHKLYKKDPRNDLEVLKELWKLLDQADIVIAHNAVKFDVRKVNTRFIMCGLNPPSPYKIVDTLKIARRYFSFMSNKLNDLGKFLRVGKKIDTGGFKLWVGCLEGDKKSWNKMVKYCKGDVVLLEKIYLKMLPYIKVHPNLSVSLNGKCPKCGTGGLQSRGTVRLVSGIMRRFRCKNCGGWSSKRERSYTKEEKSLIYKNG